MHPLLFPECLYVCCSNGWGELSVWCYSDHGDPACLSLHPSASQSRAVHPSAWRPRAARRVLSGAQSRQRWAWIPPQSGEKTLWHKSRVKTMTKKHGKTPILSEDVSITRGTPVLRKWETERLARYKNMLILVDHWQEWRSLLSNWMLYLVSVPTIKQRSLSFCTTMIWVISPGQPLFTPFSL